MKKYFILMSICVFCLAVCNIVYASTTLTDIKGTRYEDAVTNLIEVGLVNGYEDNTYRPNVAVTRAQMAKLMVIALGEEGKVSTASTKASTFTDIKSGHWAYGYVNVAKDIGIINGYLDGSFSPDATVSYAEATAMAIRALGYDDEVSKSTESWPNNYISYAKKLSLYDSVGTFSANNGAARGDIAIILWNMLRTGVCTVTGQSTNGGLIYGQGQLMLNKYKNFIYMDEGEITSVKFNDDYDEATVTINDDEDKVSLKLTDTELLKYYGRKLELLYNTNTKKLISIEDTKAYKVVEGSITKAPTSTKIYVDDDTYALPSKSNILLYKIDSLSDAIDATIIKDGSTVKYVIVSGARNVYVGYVYEEDVKVDKKDGIKIKKLDSTTNTSYALIDEDDMPNEGSIIIYYLNSDDELGIIKEIDEDDAAEIASLTSSKIKVGKITYTYNSSTFVVAEATGTAVKTLKFSTTKIDEDNDMVYVYEYAGKTYLIVFPDSVDDSEAQEKAYSTLKSYITKVEPYANKEASYSQNTFEPFIEALENAKTITSGSSTTKINSAYSKLKSTYEALRSVSSTSTEGQIAAERAKLRKLIDGDAATAVKNKAQYTSTSYTKFNTALTSAKSLLKETDNSLSEVKSAYNKLSDAINALAKLEDDQEHKDAVARLTAILNLCKEEVGPESNYTSESWSKYKTAKTAADNAKLATLTATEINRLAENLENAKSELKEAKETLWTELRLLIADCATEVDDEDAYMEDEWDEYQLAYDVAANIEETDDISTIQSAKENLEEALKALKNNTREKVLNDLMTIVKPMVSDQTLKVTEAYNSVVKNNNDMLVKINNIKSAVETDLEDLLDAANVKKATVDSEALVTLANAMLKAEKATTTEKMVEAYMELKPLV